MKVFECPGSKNMVLLVAIVAVTVILTTWTYQSAAQDRAPGFTLERIDGEKAVLSNLLKDKEVILIFWTTWCPSCRAEIPYIEKFYKKNKDKVTVLGISVGESKAKISDFAKKNKISYPIALDPDSSAARAYKVVGVPTIIAINKDGAILYSGHSIEEAGKKVDR